MMSCLTGKLPYGRCEITEWNNMFVKAFELGLADIAVKKNKGKTKAKLSFAKNSQSIMGTIRANVKNKSIGN